VGLARCLNGLLTHALHLSRSIEQQNASRDFKTNDWRLLCQDEDDQASPNARKNTRASKNSATKDEPVGTPSDSNELDLDELQRHAAEQAALFQMGDDDSNISSIPRERVPEKTEP
jgi:hypothetical protein